MNILESLYQRLSQDNDIAAVVATRIHYEQRPQNERDAALVLELASSLEFEHHANGPGGFCRGVARVTCFADQALAAFDLADLVRWNVDGFRGVIDSLDVAYLLVEDITPVPSEPQEGQARRVFAYAVDVLFGHRPATQEP